VSDLPLQADGRLQFITEDEWIQRAWDRFAAREIQDHSDRHQ
jgi:hypothetical protein